MSPPLRASSSPAHSLARRDLPVARARAFQSSSLLVKGVAEAALHCAHRTCTTHLIDHSKLARFFSFGRAPMLVYVRPSNEALLRARVPGAQDQRGCPSNLLHRARSASKKGTWSLPSKSFGGRALREHRGLTGPSLPLSMSKPLTSYTSQQVRVRTQDRGPAPLRQEQGRLRLRLSEDSEYSISTSA